MMIAFFFPFSCSLFNTINVIYDVIKFLLWSVSRHRHCRRRRRHHHCEPNVCVACAFVWARQSVENACEFMSHIAIVWLDTYFRIKIHIRFLGHRHKFHTKSREVKTLPHYENQSFHLAYQFTSFLFFSFRFCSSRRSNWAQFTCNWIFVFIFTTLKQYTKCSRRSLGSNEQKNKNEAKKKCERFRRRVRVCNSNSLNWFECKF